MKTAQNFQEQFLNSLSKTEFVLSEATRQAFLNIPRHEFVTKYRNSGNSTWEVISKDNIEQHLATLYRDAPLILVGDDDHNVKSTISQPSFVLRMIEMLDLQKGHKVFELGAGSGWNAALMGHVVGPSGSVVAVEILEELIKPAQTAIAKLKLPHVAIIQGDGGDGHASSGTFDRAIFTAGSYDIPLEFYSQIKDGGLFLCVIKTKGGADNLFLLKKCGDHFETVDSLSCGFVPMTGKHAVTDMEPKWVEDIPEWKEVKDKIVSTKPFWWGAKGKETFRWRTSGFRGYLSLVEAGFHSFKLKEDSNVIADDVFFGVWSEDQKSLTIFQNEEMKTFGTSESGEIVDRHLIDWMKLGMPSLACFKLKAYPKGVRVALKEGDFLTTQRDSKFIWSLAH
ncbi:MAG: hypothetical protein JST16_03695 [Bdellovibrionales bacterium]|nr:hypothetical protein [Bdellovibrionales bacterium]